MVCGQSHPRIEVNIRIVPNAHRVVIEATTPPTTTWSFRDTYAGVIGLGARISSFEAFDAQGHAVTVRKLAPGHFESAAVAAKYRYEVDLTPPARPSEAALVSWLNDENGVLALGDLMPAETAGRLVVLSSVPEGWLTGSVDVSKPIEDLDKAILVWGKDLRRQNGSSELRVLPSGKWAFSDSEALDLSAKILKAHSKIAGPSPCTNSTVFILPFPNASAADKWSAQTRGCSVLLLMGKQPSKVGALSQLGNALTHELFHFWIPNGLALKGDYDWFFEGFTAYQAARTAVDLDLLTFADFLTALGRANDAIASNAELNQLSLIEASQRRWTTGSSGVYAKAMLVAFLFDLNLRYQSKGKRSLNDVYRNIFRSQKRGNPSSSEQYADGNAVVLAALEAESGGQDFGKRFITAPVTIDLQKELELFGLRVEPFGFRSRIVANEKLTKRQRDLLHELGYNDRAR